MPKLKTVVRSTLAVMAIATCAISSIPHQAVLANGLPGLVIFGGRNLTRLPYRLDFGGRPRQWDRYRLRIPSSQLKIAVAQFTVTYPARFDGRFDTNEVEIFVKGKKVPLQEVIWDEENSTIEIFPEEPIAAGNAVELIFSNVRNPTYGTYYFNASILSPGDVPLPRYLGLWDLTIGQ